MKLTNQQYLYARLWFSAQDKRSKDFEKAFEDLILCVKNDGLDKTMDTKKA